jgi:hypothetical protein
MNGISIPNFWAADTGFAGKQVTSNVRKKAPGWMPIPMAR